MDQNQLAKESTIENIPLIVVVRDFFSENEIERIWKEFNFLNDNYKMLSICNNNSNCELKLDRLYNNRNFSDILKINRKIFLDKSTLYFSRINPFFRFIKLSNYDNTNLNFYKNGFNRHPTFNKSLITCISFFIKNSESLEMAKVKFQDFNIEFDIENNLTLIFPSCYLMEMSSNKISDDNSYCDAYTITQNMWITPQD